MRVVTLADDFSKLADFRIDYDLMSVKTDLEHIYLATKDGIEIRGSDGTLAGQPAGCQSAQPGADAGDSLLHHKCGNPRGGRQGTDRAKGRKRSKRTEFLQRKEAGRFHFRTDVRRAGMKILKAEIR